MTVLSILDAIALPVYECFQRRAKSTVAQQSLIAIKRECERNFARGMHEVFSSVSLKEYEIRSSGDNSCSGGLVSAVPNDTSIYPTYFYQFDDGKLSYEFRGQKGTSFAECNKLICEKAESENIASKIT